MSATLDECRKLMNRERRSKYHNTRTVGLAPDGGNRVYHSAAEARYAGQLHLLCQAGHIRAWEPQYSLPLVVNGLEVCKLIIDFRVIEADGRTRLVEVKGHATRDWKLKRRLLEALHPDLELVVVQA